MSGLEIASAAILGTQLLDAKYHIKHDVFLVQRTISGILPFLWKSNHGKASFWYYFESSSKANSKKRAIAFPRPKKNIGEVRYDAQGFPILEDQFELEEYTYREFYNIVLRLSHILKEEYGITSKDTIALNCMNKPMFLFFWLALWNIGALPAFLNFNTKGEPLLHCIKISNVSQIFIDPDCASNIKETESLIKGSAPNVKLHYINEEELLRVVQNKNTPKYRAPDNTRRPDDTDSSCCALIYTSGTTGLPKAGIMSWRKAYMAAQIFGYIMKINSNSNVLTAMPLYHSTAAILGVCPALLEGACISIAQKFSATSFWTQARICGSTHMQYVGEVCRYLINSKDHPDQTSHQVKIAYGNGLRRDIWMDFKKRFNIEAVGEFYASTESPIATTNLQYGDFGVGACRRYGSIINFILSFNQAIVKMQKDDENEIWRDPTTGFGKLADKDEPGELLMKILNPNNVSKSFQGYYGNKKATSDKLIRDVFKKGDAWFRTGDLLKMDADGLFYFVDRLGDTFRWKSENVSASEVENELMGSQAINGSVVVGVQVPQHEGRAGFAVIEPKEEYADPSKTGELLAKIFAHVDKNLPKYSIPQFIKVVGQIESSHNHKVPKNQYKKQVLPKGEDGTDTIYWLNKNKYEELTEDAWSKIMSGASKL